MADANNYNKQYTTQYQIQWKNFPDTATPLSAANLQRAHGALQAIDEETYRCFTNIDLTKLNRTEAQHMVTNIDYTPGTGTFVFHFYDGTSLSIDTNLEKVVMNWGFNQTTQKLELTQSDGTVVEVDLSNLIANPDLQDSDTIAWTINGSGQITADIKTNSIDDTKLEPNYLALLTEQANNASLSEQNATYMARLAQSYANGTSNLSDRPTENIDNADYYRQLAQQSQIACGSILSTAGNIENTVKGYKDDAEQSMIVSGSYMRIAGNYADDAEQSSIVSGSAMRIAGNYANEAEQSAIVSGSSMRMAGISETNAKDYARKAQSYATGDAVDDNGDPYRTGQADDNAKKYYELTRDIAQGSGVADMTGATSTEDGTHGLVTQPQAGDQDKFLRGNGTWDYAGNDSLVAFVETTSTSARAYAVGDQFVYNRKLYTATSAIDIGDTLTPGTNCEESDNVTNQIKSVDNKVGLLSSLATTVKTSVVAAINEIVGKITNKVLFYTSVACSATTGNFATVSNAAITADHIVTECVFANPSAITTDVTWTTAAGSLTLNGTCTTATTATITLVKKDN